MEIKIMIENIQVKAVGGFRLMGLSLMTKALFANPHNKQADHP